MLHCQNLIFKQFPTLVFGVILGQSLYVHGIVTAIYISPNLLSHEKHIIYFFSQCCMEYSYASARFKYIEFCYRS